METDLSERIAHPVGEQPEVEEWSAVAETFAGRVHIEWDTTAAVTPLGQLPFFIEYLKQGGLFDGWVADCPLVFTSPNAPRKREPGSGRRPQHRSAVTADPNILGASAYRHLPGAKGVRPDADRSVGRRRPGCKRRGEGRQRYGTPRGSEEERSRACSRALEGLLDDKVDVAPMVQPAHHHNAFARTRMLGVLDQNVKGLFLGGMSPSRRGPCPSTN